MKRKMLPMNLQFFAEDSTDGQQKSDTNVDDSKQPETTSTPEDKKDAGKPDSKPDGKEPSLQELMVELAKVKRAQEKAASEAAEYKKKWKDSLSEQEKASMEKAEAQAKRDEEFESMKKTIAIHDLTENFMDLGYDKTLAKKAAQAQVDGDTAALLEIQKQFQEQQQKKWESDFLASRPDINVGGQGSSQAYTKEQFEKMTMQERTKLKRENPAEYDRLKEL